MTLKHYVEFMFPGVFMPETSVKEVETRNIVLDDIPENCYAYRFYSRTENKQDGETLKGKKKNYSKMYYFGRLLNAEQVKNEVEKPDILLSNMRINDWEHVVETRFGNFQPFKKGAVIVGP